VKELQLEMEEMHDQFREEETTEIRELQRELETTAKACRIVNFKLRKAERRCDQLEAEKIQAEEKSRQLEARFKTSDDRQHLLELEEELRMAKVTIFLVSKLQSPNHLQPECDTSIFYARFFVISLFLGCVSAIAICGLFLQTQ